MNKKWIFLAGIFTLSCFHLGAAAAQNIDLDNLSIDKCVAGAFVGNLSVSNAPDDQYTFTVDDNRFVVEGSRLSLKSTLSLCGDGTNPAPGTVTLVIDALGTPALSNSFNLAVTATAAGVGLKPEEVDRLHETLLSYETCFYAFVKNGVTVSRWYTDDINACVNEQRSGDGDTQNLKSVTKNITGILIGIAIDRGFISGVGDRVADYFQTEGWPDYTDAAMNTRAGAMTIEDLLYMRAGFQWNQSSDSRQMRKIDDNPADAKPYYHYVLAKPVIVDPGEEYVYSSGVSNLLIAILHKALLGSQYNGVRDFAQRELLGPIGIEPGDYRWRGDSSSVGLPDGASAFDLMPAKLAKVEDLARLLQNYGFDTAGNTYVIPRSYYLEMIDYRRGSDETRKYAYHTWREKFDYADFDGNGRADFLTPKRGRHENDSRVFGAKGKEGQYIFWDLPDANGCDWYFVRLGADDIGNDIHDRAREWLTQIMKTHFPGDLDGSDGCLIERDSDNNILTDILP